MLVADDAQILIEVTVEPFDKHGVVIGPTEDMAIDLKQIKGFKALAKELAVLVEDGSVAKAKTKDDLNDRGSIHCCICISDGFHHSKS